MPGGAQGKALHILMPTPLPCVSLWCVWSEQPSETRAREHDEQVGTKLLWYSPPITHKVCLGACAANCVHVLPSKYVEYLWPLFLLAIKSNRSLFLERTHFFFV